MNDPARETDEALVEACRRGDRRAFATLFDRHKEWVVSLAWRFCGNREDALDVLQETFVYFFKKLPGFELRCRLKTFLYPVVKHIALRRAENARRRMRLVTDQAGAAPREEPAEIEQLLGNLPEPQREVVLLRFVDGLDLKEIAEALEVPLGTVKSRLHTALQALRKNTIR